MHPFRVSTSGTAAHLQSPSGARWAAKVNRANQAHLNAVESFAPFAAVVLAAGALGLSNAVTQACAATYFNARLAHAGIHLSAFGHFKARTVAFTVAWLAFVVIAAEVLRSAGR